MAAEPPATHRRPRARIGEGGRRLQSAGAAIAVAFGAVSISLLLNAPGLHKSAQIQPEGWKRDVALAVTGPLESVSGALLLDQPRRGLKAALGRSGDDEIDTEVGGPARPSPDRTPKPAPPPKRERFTPDRRLRLWVAGDSLVVVPGESVLRAAGSSRVLEPVGPVEGRIATGLERPDVFNWFTRVRTQPREERARAIVLMFGGNDDHGFMTGLPEGVEIGPFGSESWTAEYRRRVGLVMDEATERGAYLVWIGIKDHRGWRSSRSARWPSPPTASSPRTSPATSSAASWPPTAASSSSARCCGALHSTDSDPTTPTSSGPASASSASP